MYEQFLIFAAGFIVGSSVGMFFQNVMQSYWDNAAKEATQFELPVGNPACCPHGRPWEWDCEECDNGES